MTSPTLHFLRDMPLEQREVHIRALAAERKREKFKIAQVQAEAVRELERLEHEAMLARQSLTKLERQSSAVRENGGSMPVAFWNVFADAVKTVRLAERDVSKAREKVR